MAKSKTVQKGKRFIGVNLDADVYAALVKRASTEKRSVSNMVHFFVSQGVDTAGQSPIG